MTTNGPLEAHGAFVRPEDEDAAGSGTRAIRVPCHPHDPDIAQNREGRVMRLKIRPANQLVPGRHAGTRCQDS